MNKPPSRFRSFGKLTIHETRKCEVDKSKLPKDAEFKGYQPAIVQDILISPHNILFEKEIYYSPSLKKTFIAPSPDGYTGDFSPNIKALILDMHHHENATESAIHHFLTTHGIEIGKASISRILTDRHESFHQEKKVSAPNFRVTPPQRVFSSRNLVC